MGNNTTFMANLWEVFFVSVFQTCVKFGELTCRVLFFAGKLAVVGFITMFR